LSHETFRLRVEPRIADRLSRATVSGAQSPNASAESVNASQTRNERSRQEDIWEQQQEQQQQKQQQAPDRQRKKQEQQHPQQRRPAGGVRGMRPHWTGSYAGCLSADASPSLRCSVMVHDLDKLVARLGKTHLPIPGQDTTDYSAEREERAEHSESEPKETHSDTLQMKDAALCLQESDFATLVHQCRKRKWCVFLTLHRLCIHVEAILGPARLVFMSCAL
jgi:hypothetical protein